MARPAVDGRSLLATGVLDLEEGLVGDSWRARGGSRSVRGAARRAKQLTVMNARAAALVAGPDHEAWALAGDQLYVDLDLGEDALPAGARLSIGTAEIEVSAEPHTGCGKFAARFGQDAWRFVNSPSGRSLRLRGLNASVVVPGHVALGDDVIVLGPSTDGGRPGEVARAQRSVGADASGT